MSSNILKITNKTTQQTAMHASAKTKINILLITN